jgi:ferredoxin--NADP+ reductase
MNTDTLAGDKATRETITQMHRWTDKLITFRTTRPAGYIFTPGQYARLGLPDGDSMIWRAYSVTSAPDEDTLEFYGIIVDGGQFTSRLDQLKPGDFIWLDRQVFGFMTASRFNDGDQLWMLATGTGVGPFISILRDPETWRRWRHLVLVHCVRHKEELAYEEELRRMQASAPAGVENPGALHLLQSVTREEADGGLLHGRITALLASGSLEQAAGLPLTLEQSRIMLCGNPAMIEETRKLLHQRGMKPVRRVNPGQFVTENYW